MYEDDNGATSDENPSPRKGESSATWRRRSITAVKQKIEKAAARVTNGTLTMCDLAGSEDVGRSGASGLSLSEAQKINTSLLALGNVIQALTTKGHTHVPFRNSVLTRILQESIGGNSKTTLIVCASPADGDVTETLSTLRFAARAKRVKNVAKVNAHIEAAELVSDQLAESLQSHLDEQHKALDEARQANMESAEKLIQAAVRLAVRKRLVARM